MHFDSTDEVNRALTDMYPGVTLVYGAGPVPCDVMFAGEAPGADEIITGRAFTGQAGKIFEDVLEKLGLTRDGIFITNTCKFRPYRTSGTGRKANRTPTKVEIADAAPFLLEEIRLVNPKVLITLGNTPLRAITGLYTMKVGETHGGQVIAEIPGANPYIFSLYHPASLIYRPALRGEFDSDLAKLKEILDDVCGRNKN